MTRSCIRILASVTVAALFTVFPTHQARAAEATQDQTVVLISVDGLAGFYFDDPKCEMPNIRALAKAGARASLMKAVSPTVTWPNHTTLVTGVTPARHGVVGNNFFNRAKNEQVTLIFDPVLDKDEIVKVPTIYDVAKSNGLRTVGINWPASRNAHSLDWTIPEVRFLNAYLKYTTPALLKECMDSGFNVTNAVFDGDKRNMGMRTDDAYTRVVNIMLEKHHPHLLIFHIGNVDHIEHEKGPQSPEAYAAIKHADEQVGAVWKTLQKEFPGKATLFVVSDHGFSPIKTTLLPNIALRQAGLITVKDKTVSGDVRAVSQGGSSLIYVLDDKNRDAIVTKIEKTFRKVKGVAKIVMPNEFKKYGVANPKDDPNAPDLILMAKEGYTFGDTTAGDVPFNDKPERLGSHGHDPSLPALHATFVAWGAGIKSGSKIGEINNLDVAPTIAKILRLSLPATDGKALSEILTE